jgi:hypothetical protein
MGNKRLQGNFDLFNLLNANTVLGVITRYGPTWQRPNAILGARLAKFGFQLDF